MPLLQVLQHKQKPNRQLPYILHLDHRILLRLDRLA